eukprot:scaffold102894_cov19-Tisochrysis_lutea.AAC.3
MVAHKALLLMLPFSQAANLVHKKGPGALDWCSPFGRIHHPKGFNAIETQGVVLRSERKAKLCRQRRLSLH